MIPSATARSAILGVPLDPNKQPSGSSVVRAIEQLDARVIANSAGALIRNSVANLSTLSSPAAGAMAWVIGDATVANNGVYENTGTSGSPTWDRRGPLPFAYINAINVGAGTANAIQVTTAIPIPTEDGAAEILVPIVSANTSATVTLAINGESPLPVKTQSGGNPSIGGLTGFMKVIKLSSTWRMMTDQASAAIQSAAEAAADRAEAAADDAVAAAASIISLSSYSITTAASAATNTTGFGNLEAAYAGRNVDLQGGTYAVTSIPVGNQYFNGAFSVSGTIYVMPRLPFGHPLDGGVYHVPTQGGPRQHPWVGPAGVFTDDTMVRFLAADGTFHETDIGGRLLMEVSFSGGASWINPITVYQSDSFEPRGLVGGMNQARTRMLVTWLDSAGSAGNLRYAFTTDGESYTKGAIVGGASVFYPHGDMVEDASGNVYVFGVRSSTALCVAKGVWGGSDFTWTVTTIATLAGGGEIAEPVALLTVSGWVIIVRDDNNTNSGNAYGLTCDLDFSNPSSFNDSGIPLGKNPAAGISAWGRGHYYLTARRSTPIYGYQNVLLHGEVDLDALYAADGVFPSSVIWRPVVRLDNFGLGYTTIYREKGGRFAAMAMEAEAQVGSPNYAPGRIVKIGGQPISASVPAAVAQRRSTPPAQYDPGIQHWTASTSIVCAAGTLTKTSDGLMCSSNTESMTVAREVIGDGLRDRLPHKPYYAARCTSAVGGSGRYFRRRVYGREAVERLARQPHRLNFIWSGDLPGYYQFGIAVNFGSGGSTTVTDAVTAAQDEDTDNPLIWLSEILAFGPSDMDGKSWGALPYFEISMLANDAGAVDGYLYGFWSDTSIHQIPLDPADLNADRAVIDKHIMKMQFAADDMVCVTNRASDDVGIGNVPISPRMISDPVMSLIDSTTAASFYVNSSGNTLSDFSFDGVGRNGFRLRVERTGAFSGNSQEIRCVSSGTILLDAQPAP
jgi:hypothetical protein